jgi:hypothetical protein
MKKGPPYRVEWADEAWAEVLRLKAFERRPVIHLGGPHSR